MAKSSIVVFWILLVLPLQLRDHPQFNPEDFQHHWIILIPKLPQPHLLPLTGNVLTSDVASPGAVKILRVVRKVVSVEPRHLSKINFFTP